MRKYIAAFVVLVSSLASWTDAVACSCARPVLADLYKDSTHVILGEVVKIELLTENPVHDQDVIYVATLKPVETYKGPSNVDVRVTYKARYFEPGRPMPPRPTTVDETTGEVLELVIIDSCGGAGMAVGARYFAFEKQGEVLQHHGWCTQRVMYEPIVQVQYMRSLRDAR